MSALAIEAPLTYFTDASAEEQTTSPTHPRGRGFGVLSRIARVQASQPDYVPRHRLDASV